MSGEQVTSGNWYGMVKPYGSMVMRNHFVVAFSLKILDFKREFKIQPTTIDIDHDNGQSMTTTTHKLFIQRKGDVHL